MVCINHPTQYKAKVLEAEVRSLVEATTAIQLCSDTDRAFARKYLNGNCFTLSIYAFPEKLYSALFKFARKGHR